jgi:LuxR family transcriptional regulator, maltose regulon positive regulatory protein
MDVEAGGRLRRGRSHIVERPRLKRLIDQATPRIVLLVAPAGYGKTILAHDWLANRRHTWYRGHQAIADVAALALGLARAVADVVPGAGERMRKRLRVSGTPQLDAEQLADLLAADLGGWPDSTWLAFDDYHFACDSDPAERFVEQLVAAAPVRLLIASRSRPRWADARRLMYSDVYEIGRQALAMNRDEADAVLAAAGVEGTAELITLAGGWPALIGLAAQSDEIRMPFSALPEELYTFVADELYHAASPDIRAGLRRLSLAPVVTPDIAESLAGTEARTVVQEGKKLGFFLAASGEKLEFHPLLRSFLIARFVENRDDPEGVLVAGLARMLIGREEWDDTFELITRFFKEQLLIELLEGALPRMVDEARVPTLARWIELATTNRVDSPVLDLAEAEVELKQGEWRRAEALATQAARRISEGHAFHSKALWLAGTSAHLLARNEIALAYFDRAAEAARSDLDARQALWGRFTATAYLDDVTNAVVALAELEEISGHTIDELLRIATGRMILTSFRGSIRETLEEAETMAQLASRARDPLIYSSFLNVYSGVLSLGARYADALKAGEDEISIAQTYGIDFVRPYGQAQIALARWGLRQFQLCKSTLRECERTSSATCDEFLLMNINTLRSRLALAIGNPDDALDNFERYQHRGSTRGMDAEYRAWWSLTLAVARRNKQAAAMAEQALEMSPRIEVSALVAWTRAVLAVNRRRAARQTTEEAFRLARETGNLDAFVSAYRACPALLGYLAGNRSNHEPLTAVLERSRDHSLARTVGIRLPTTADTNSVLSRREQEVLQLLAQGLTNREIGQTLFITEGTAKAHVRSICQKLGVRTRTEAALRAAEFCD